MNAGIVIVAFGDDYLRLARESIQYSRKNTDLPFHVAVNNPNTESLTAIGGVSVTYFNRHQNDNRKAKLSLPDISPFDLSLYIDVDSVIQGNGVEKFIGLLDEGEMVFNQRVVINPGEKIWNIYRRCMDKFSIEKPIAIHNGGIFAFRKSQAVRDFFNMWKVMWKEFGSGREMPPLNCCIKKTGINISLFPQGYFADSYVDDEATVQHCWHLPTFCSKFGLTKWRENKPFDRGQVDDFHFERNPK